MAEIKSAFTPKQRAIWRMLFGEELGLAPTAEERVRLGQASKTDSIATGLLPRAAGLSEYERLRLRFPEEARAKIDSMKAGLLPRTSTGTTSIYEQWLTRQPEAVRDSAFKMRAGLIPRAGKAEEPKRESILAAGGRYAEKIAKTRKQMGATLPVTIGEMFTTIMMPAGKKREDYLGGVLQRRKPLIEKEEPAYKNLEKTLETYGDSASIARRALEKFSPDNDMNELVGSFPIARQALAEWKTWVKQGMTMKEASQKIQEKYGYDLKTLERIYYVETGR